MRHMLEAAHDAVKFVRDRQRADLDSDAMLLRALVNCVQVIGEAASQVSDAGRSKAPNIPWPKIVGMRHILVHAYFNIDCDSVWRVIDQHLPALITDLQTALSGDI